MTERTGSNGKGLGESRNGEANGTDSFRLSEFSENFKLGQIVAINRYMSVRPYLILCIFQAAAEDPYWVSPAYAQ